MERNKKKLKKISNSFFSPEKKIQFLNIPGKFFAENLNEIFLSNSHATLKMCCICVCTAFLFPSSLVFIAFLCLCVCKFFFLILVSFC